MTTSHVAKSSWLQAMLGQGNMPQAFNPIATALFDDEMSKLSDPLRRQGNRTVAIFCAHGEYIVGYYRVAQTAKAAAA